MAQDIVKAGSVQRLSTVLKRWKPAWVVVYANGNFSYFESENSFIPKATLHLPTQCRRVISKPKHVDPPQGLSKECLFGLLSNESDWFFCAESPDDAMTWRMALAEAKGVVPVHQIHIPPAAAHRGYTDGVNYYQRSAYPETTVPLYNPNYPLGSPTIPTVYRGVDGELVVPEQIIEHADGSRTIVLGVGNEIVCRCRRGYHCGCGYGYGDAALLGLAAGTLMWSPFMWAPFFWC